MRVGQRATAMRVGDRATAMRVERVAETSGRRIGMCVGTPIDGTGGVGIGMRVTALDTGILAYAVPDIALGIALDIAPGTAPDIAPGTAIFGPRDIAPGASRFMGPAIAM